MVSESQNSMAGDEQAEAAQRKTRNQRCMMPGNMEWKISTYSTAATAIVVYSMAKAANHEKTRKQGCYQLGAGHGSAPAPGRDRTEKYRLTQVPLSRQQPKGDMHQNRVIKQPINSAKRNRIGAGNEAAHQGMEPIPRNRRGSRFCRWAKFATCCTISITPSTGATV